MADLRALVRRIEELERRAASADRRLGSLPSRMPHVANAGGAGVSLEDSEEIDSQGRKLAVWWIRANLSQLEELEVDSPALVYTTDDGVAWRKQGQGEDAHWVPWAARFADKAALDAFDCDAPTIHYTEAEDNYWGRSGDADEGSWKTLMREIGDWP